MTPYLGEHWKNVLPMLYFGVMRSPSNTFLFLNGQGERDVDLCVLQQRAQNGGRWQAGSGVLRREASHVHRSRRQQKVERGWKADLLE